MSSVRAVQGHPVIVEDSAEQAGSVTGFVVDPKATTIQAIYLGGRGASGRFVSWGDIASFGTDAVMIKHSGSVRDGVDEREQRTASHDLALLDRRVLTDSGDELGVVDDIEFDPTDGHLEELTVDGEPIGPDRLLGIGSYAVIVSSLEDDE